MFAVAKKSRPIGAQAPREIPGPRVSANTTEWRTKANAELDARGRGARADLTRHLRSRYPTFSSGQLTDILGNDEKPGQKRYSQYIDDINQYLWPKLMPLSQDTDEMRYLLAGLADADKNLLREILDMGHDEQRALAQFIALTRKPK